MDILSDVITSMRTGHPATGLIEWHAPWGYRFPTQPDVIGFLVVLRGGGTLIRESQDPVPLAAGDVVFTPHGDGYAIADHPATPLIDPADDPGDIPCASPISTMGSAPGAASTVTLWGGYEIDPSWTHPLLRDLPPVIHMSSRPGRNPGLRAAIDLLGAEIETDRPGSDALRSVLLDMLLLYLLRAWFDDQPDRGTGWAAALADDAVRAALNTIHHDPASQWTVQMLAESARLSRAAFSRRFRNLTGQSPLAYLTWWRLTIAADTLRKTDAPLSQVSSRIGYSSEYAFANAFKRQYGIAPGRFRRTATPPAMAA